MKRSSSAEGTLASCFPEECRIAHLENNSFIYGAGPALNWKLPEYILPKYQINSSTSLNQYQDPVRKKFSLDLKNISNRLGSKNKPASHSLHIKIIDQPDKSKMTSFSRAVSVPVRKMTEKSTPISIVSPKFSDLAEKNSEENHSLGLEESLRILKNSRQEALGRTRTSNTSNHSQDSLVSNSSKHIQGRLSSMSKASQEEISAGLNTSVKRSQSRHSSLLNHSGVKDSSELLNQLKHLNRDSDSGHLEDKKNQEKAIFYSPTHSITGNLSQNDRSRSISAINSRSSILNIETLDLDSRKPKNSSLIHSDTLSKRSKSTLGSINRSEKAEKISETKNSTTKNNPIFQNSLKKSYKSDENFFNHSKPANSSEISSKEEENSYNSKKNSLKFSNPGSENSKSFSQSQSSKSSSNVNQKQSFSSKNPAFTNYYPSGYYESLGLSPPHPFPNYSKRSLKRKKSDTHHFKQTFNSKLRSSENESYTYS